MSPAPKKPEGDEPKPEETTTPSVDEAPAAAPQEEAQGLDAPAEGEDAKAEASTEEPKAEEKPKPKRKPAAKKQAEVEEEPLKDAQGDELAEAAPKPKPRSRRTSKPQEEPDDRPKAEKAEKSAKKPASAPKAQAKPAAPARVTVRAQAKYVRSSARKARLVCDLIRGKSVEDARAILSTTPRSVSRDWSKVLESAVANAENNHDLDGDELRIFAVHADEGPTLKRFRPRAMGRATRIRKRTSHLTILLAPKE
jgi:ribosomal protein L22